MAFGEKDAVQMSADSLTTDSLSTRDSSALRAAFEIADGQASAIWSTLKTTGGVAKQSDGHLYGELFAVGNNIDVAGFPNTAACPSFNRRGVTPVIVVQKLLDAGAFCTGKSNLDQFACPLLQPSFLTASAPGDQHETRCRPRRAKPVPLS